MAQYKICHILLRLSLSDFLFCFLMKKYLHKKHHMNGGHHESKPRDSLKTEMVMTMNLRSWRNFLRLRTSKASHPQCREVACSLLKLFSEKYPAFFKDLLEDN